MINRSGTLITLVRSEQGAAASEWVLLLCLLIVVFAVAALFSDGLK